MVVQSVANHGKMMKPWLIQSIEDARGRITYRGKKEILKKTMDPELADRILAVMKEAGDQYGLHLVTEDGRSCKIAAKTGTAQRGDGTNNAWLVTCAPAEDPRYVVVVSRLKTKKIGLSLGPLAEEMYEELFDNYDKDKE